MIPDFEKLKRLIPRGLNPLDPGNPRPGDWAKVPFSIQSNGKHYVCVTDKTALLAIESNASTIQEAPDQVNTMLDPPKRAISVTIFERETLANFLGEPHWGGQQGPCVRCDGRGEHTCTHCKGDGTYDCECPDCGNEHNVDCDECDGNGIAQCEDGCEDGTVVVKPENRPGLICGIGINRNLIARVLDCLPELPNEIQFHIENGDVLRFYGAGFVALVMPLRLDNTDDVPELK